MLAGTAVYGTVRTVVWEDGGEIPPPTRLYDKIKKEIQRAKQSFATDSTLPKN